MIIGSSMRLYFRDGIAYVGLPGNKRRSLKTRDKQVAERLFKRLKREALLGNVVALERQQKYFLKDFITEYLKHCKAHKSSETYIRDAYSVNKLLEYMGNVPLQSITPKRIDAFHSRLINSGFKPSGVDITFRHCRSAFSQAVKWEYLKTNPYKIATKIKVKKKPPRFYSEDELKRIFEEIEGDKDFHDLITCYLLSGMRRGELFYLRSRTIDFDNNLITVVKSKTTFRTLPLEEPVREILKRRCKKSGIGSLWPTWKHPNAITHRWIRLMNKLKMTGRLHDLRHSFASHMAMKGEHIRVIQDWLGHTDISTTMMYSHLSPDHMRKAVSSLGNLHRISTGQYPHTVKSNKNG